MKTEIINLDNSFDREAVRKVACLLEQGGIAAIPTETVYGLAARAFPDTLERLNALKGRSPDKRYTLHIGTKEEVSKYVPDIPFPMAKLVKRCWPGPVTLVFELGSESLNKQKKSFSKETYDILYSGGTIGLRCPDFPVCREILSSTFVPVLMPSANPSSLEPARSVEKILEYFGGRIDLIVDGGEQSCRHKKSSSVVKYGTKGLEVLREGSLSNDFIINNAIYKILFVCTGNTCRSPMAESICKKILSDKLGCSIDSLERFGYKVESAGIFALDGLPASKEADIICREYGAPLKGHKSRVLTRQMLQDSDLVFVMASQHLVDVKRISASTPVSLLDEGAEIPDPMGQDLEVYRRCAAQIEQSLLERIKEVYDRSGFE